ncbi:RNA polymerase factor sigma-54 [Methylobacterium planeticum]|uniref:RNA polymerase sigma-54 factor n=1 Tax=Methylobacterium planeticum TaxID=2615211 RepID=A0A6N6MVE0_9HYPH|nr:RNA polymerase factor sigma-54 [Methylobacterium planeticum]KAB1075710.1 RNA polymerase factor sigma-54 [Methylobacterium planeticum]
MSLLQRLEMRQGQALVMTPQLLQAIKLLQLSQLDLAAYVDAELERNPLLERVEGEGGEAREAADAAPDVPEAGFDGEGEGGEAEAWLPTEMSQSQIEGDFDTRLDNVFPDDTPSPAREAASGDMLSLTPAPYGSTGGSFDAEAPDFDATLTAEISLREHLSAQLDLATRDPRDRLIGGFLIDAVDEAGYMREPIDAVAERLGTGLDDVARVLKLIQTFDPAGVAARDLAECLSLQLRERDRFDPAMQALVSRLDLVAKRDFAGLRRLCGVDDEDLVEMLGELRRLDPKPGRAFGASAVEVLIPDVFVRMGPDGAWLVELNAETLPRVLVNQSYYARVSRGAAAEGDKAFLSECLQTANWLTRSLEQRARTILKVATEIVRQQDGFFVHGVAHLRPLNLKTVAEAIGMHESTVSRVTSNKSIGTSRGTLEMKYFFTAAIPGAAGTASHSSEAVRHRIKQLVDGEAPSDVLSDDALVQRLRDEGIDIARRTVAKYRESLRIPSSIERRRDHFAHAGR